MVQRTSTPPRLFIAVELPEAVREQLRQAIAGLRRPDLEAVRWVRPEGIHLTLHFLGETLAERMEDIHQAMSQAAVSAQLLTLRVQGAGAFPNMRAPQVVWLGLSEQTDALRDLQARLEAALVQHGFTKEERDFSPHLTLGRVNGRLSALGLQALAEGLRQAEAVEFPSIPVDGISLMESRLERSGARYMQRRLVRLGGW